ncbi:MAG TPA: AAA family ATPase [Polyangiaceae bacterium]|nr:AAA family ATPase [Polyangiaceae bacterium]
MVRPFISIPGVEVLDELGRGAHSAVFRVRRGGRYYATKVPQHDGDAHPPEEFTQRFLREAVTLARVRHPALPAVMEVGRAGEVPYIIMELAAGETLAERLRQGPLDEDQVTELALQLADALGKIHDSGLVHRDIKPTNILFDSHTTAVRLVDFGLAGSQAAGSSESEVDSSGTLPRSATRLGDSRADLFALGCVLFECVTGAVPWNSADPEPMLERHAASPALPPFVSRRFAGILRRLLGLGEEEAYFDAHALHDDLRRLRQPGSSISLRPTGNAANFGRSAPVPLFGRDRELDRLRAAWRASASGRGQVVLVRGGRGAGKTGLIRAFLEEIEKDGQHFFALSCENAQHEPFSVARQLIEAHLTRADGLPPAKRLAAIAAFRAQAGEAASLLRGLSPRLSHIFSDAPPLPRMDAAEHIFSEGLAELIHRLLEEGAPVTVVIDDVQWLDAGSRRVIGRLIDQSASRVLYLLSGRDDPECWPAVDRLLRTLEPERVWELSLDGFDEQQVSELSRAYLGQERLDPELLRYIAGLSDGTPLGVLETLRSMLDGGVLVPFWGEWRFDRDAAAQMGLPRGSLELLARRIAELNPASTALLSAGAVAGMTFDDQLAAGVSAQSPAAARALLFDARRAMLVEVAGKGSHRFVHDAVREALLRSLLPDELAELHQRLAEALDQDGSPLSRVLELATDGLDLSLSLASESEPAVGSDATTARDHGPAETREFVISLAAHYLDGEPERRPERVLRSCRAAAELSFRAFDNELSLRFFQGAERAAERTGATLPLGFELLHAEALLRTGAIEPGVSRLRAIVTRAEDPVTRAFALYRAAWAEMQFDTKSAWATLAEAFQALSVTPPGDSITDLVPGILVWLRRSLFAKRTLVRAEDRRRAEVLSSLYYQAGRLAFHTAKPLRLVHAALRGLLPAERLGTPTALTRSYSLYSFVLTALGFRTRGRHWLTVGEQLAKSARNPVEYAQALQVHVAIAGLTGNIREALQVGAHLLNDYGHFRELGEYCLTAYNQQQIEAVRGRNLEAWKWLERAAARLTRHEGPPTALEFMEVSVRAALLSLGRHQEPDFVLARLVELTTRPRKAGNEIMSAYGSRVRLFTECGELGSEFEALVDEVKRAKFDPRRVPLEVTEYYVQVAHARVHACLRVPASERAPLLPALDSALADLRLAARMPLLAAHAKAIEGCRLFFGGALLAAERALAEAERLGQEEGAPWVLYAVHRCRAHMLEAAGKSEAARDQARLAEALSREHGAAYRLRWIRQEFGLKAQHQPGGHTSSAWSEGQSSHSSDAEHAHSRARSRGYLKSLVRLGQRSARELLLDEQVRTVLDELVEALRADRGLLFLTREWLEEERALGAASAEMAQTLLDPSSESGTPSGVRERLVLSSARSAAGHELEGARGYDPRLVEDLLSFGAIEQREEFELGRGSTLASYADRAVIAVPLSVRGARIGVVYLDRPLRVGGFSDSDSRVLSALAAQVPLVFELARSLRVRERIEETERGAEKLEAIGRLAGGIAHDFNNMLSVILAASDQILSKRSTRTVAEDINTIQSAAQRARDLTRQLLAFSRGQYLNPEVIVLNDLIWRLEPIFRRLLGESIELLLDLDASLCRVKADPAQIDQVLTNLVVNAGDAMGGNGRLSIETSTVTVRRDHFLSPRALAPGRYACIVVSDTGGGMAPETAAKAFEPFFTTKDSGSGLGLATAYGIVTQSGGHLELENTPGVGATFRIYLPETVQRASLPAPPESGDAIPRGTETILLVDDEPLVRESTRRMLSSLGYNVISAKNSEEALAIAGERLEAIDLVISDVIMPGMNGLELARELSRLRPAVKVLFVSGYTAGVLAERGVLKESVAFLQKPIAMEALAPRLRTLLEQRRS